MQQHVGIAVADQVLVDARSRRLPAAAAHRRQADGCRGRCPLESLAWQHSFSGWRRAMHRTGKLGRGGLYRTGKTPTTRPLPAPLSARIGRLYNRKLMAIIEVAGLAKSYRVYQKKEGLLASLRGLFHRAVSPGRSRARHRPDRRIGRIRRLSRAQRRRQDHHAQAALGRHPSRRPAPPA